MCGGQGDGEVVCECTRQSWNGIDASLIGVLCPFALL